MESLLLAGASWLHLLATVVLIGQYVLLALIYFPQFKTQLSGEALGIVLEGIGGRLRPFIGGSVLTFIVTGFYLMLQDPGYQGFGNFDTAWSIIMLAKHVLVLAFIVLGIYSERALVGQVAATQGGPAAVARLGTALNAMLLLGVAILLLTALASVQ